jgi:hypothetical protein
LSHSNSRPLPATATRPLPSSPPSPIGSLRSVREDGEIEVAEALGVADDLDLDDADASRRRPRATTSRPYAVVFAALSIRVFERTTRS